VAGLVIADGIWKTPATFLCPRRSQHGDRISGEVLDPISLLLTVTFTTMKRLVTLFLFAVSGSLFSCGFAWGQDAKKPKWQYQTDDIRIAIPTADEPRVKAFNQDTIAAASKYLDDGAVAWVQSRSCVACHTSGAYMVDRPMLSKSLGLPRKEIFDNFVQSLQSELPPTKVSEGITYYSLAERAVWRAAGLAQWDKHVTGTTSEATDRALRMMLRQQSSHGGYYMPDPVEIPYETTDLELTQHAARAMVEAPGWLASLDDPDLLHRIERLKSFLQSASPRHD
jgi:squalene-hopene/tetraprenyl-beta-curcumene cyclase